MKRATTLSAAGRCRTKDMSDSIAKVQQESVLQTIFKNGGGKKKPEKEITKHWSDM